MSGKEIFLTYEGLRKLEDELERLKGEKDGNCRKNKTGISIRGYFRKFRV